MSKKIVIVDDDQDLLDALAGVLQTNGYTVIVENDGRKGFALAKQEQPDLLMLDVMMPDSDGFEIAREINRDESTNKIPVIILTGIRKAMNFTFKFAPDEVWLPVKAVLEKPVNPELLLKTVQTYI